MIETENIRAITDFLFIEDELDKLKPANLVIVLCNNNIKGIAEVVDDLYRREVITDKTKVIISGNHGPLDDFPEKECDLVRDRLVNDYGYQDNFILEGEATNIYENLAFSKKKIDDINKYQNIILIGAAFALRRIKLCASGLGYPTGRLQFVGTVNVERRNCGRNNWWMNDEARTRVYQEIERIGKYLVKGDLDIK